jgi:hypothetical protein
VNGDEAGSGLTITGSAVPGNTVFVNFTSGLQSEDDFDNSALANENGVWTITLTSAQVALLGQGAETITAVQTTSDGYVSDSASTTIQIDTLLPGSATIALGNGVSNGATLAEATAAGGVVTVTGDAGNTIEVTFTGTNGSVTKTVSGLGDTPIAVALDSSNVATLGQGPVSVSAKQIDPAGNEQAAATTTNFDIDTTAPSGVSIQGGSTITTNDATPTITVNVANESGAEDGATVDLLVNGRVVASSTLTGGATSVAIDLPTLTMGHTTLLLA